MQMLQSLWAYRGFIHSSVRRDFHARYRNSLLGAAWAILNPLALIAVYTLIFSQVMRARLPGIEGTFGYSIYLCAGLLSWGYFAEVTTRGQNMFIENANLLAALRDADRRKDEFMAMLAHELRNPLAPIRNSLHLLRLRGGACRGITRQRDADQDADDGDGDHQFDQGESGIGVAGHGRVLRDPKRAPAAHTHHRRRAQLLLRLFGFSAPAAT